MPGGFIHNGRNYVSKMTNNKRVTRTYVNGSFWELRFTRVPNDIVVEAFKKLPATSRVIICSEGGVDDVEPHHHAYLHLDGRTPDWVRKLIQSLDKTRKGNALYSMKQAHGNSMNYVLKEHFRHKIPIVYVSGFTPEDIDDARTQHDAYLANIEEAKKTRTREKKYATSFSKEVIYTLSDKYRCERETTGRVTEYSDIVKDLLDLYQEADKRLPSRSSMETLVLTLYSKQGLSAHLINYYSSGFQYLRNGTW